MTKVRFFHGANDRVAAAAIWLQRIWSSRKDATAQQVIVFAPDARVAEQIDRQLWLHPAGSFTPHCHAASPLAAETPIVISTSLASLGATRQLLNLADSVPPEFSRYDEIVEIVSQSGPDKLPARERFKFYRERGYELHNQDISAGVRMNDSDDDRSRDLISKADEFLNRRRVQLGNAMMEAHPAEITEVPETVETADDIPVLTEVVSEADGANKFERRRISSADVAREMEAWLDENMPQVVLHALDGVTDRLIAMVHESARADLLPRLKRAVGNKEKSDEED